VHNEFVNIVSKRYLIGHDLITFSILGSVPFFALSGLALPHQDASPELAANVGGDD
jgi:hypothetical protein